MTTPHPSYVWRHRYALAIVLGVLFALVVFQAVDSTGDDYTCPDGTTFDYKIDGLGDIDTFVVPDASPGSTIVAVIIKAGPDHHPYAPVTPGQTLTVKADVGHGASHAHICETLEVPPSTTDPATTSSAPPTTTQPPTSTSSTVPSSTTFVSTTTVVASTSSSSPPTSSVPATSTSSTPQPTQPSTTSTTVDPSTTTIFATTSTVPPTVGSTLPATGVSNTKLLVSGFGMLAAGAGLVLAGMLARRPR